MINIRNLADSVLDANDSFVFCTADGFSNTREHAVGGNMESRAPGEASTSYAGQLSFPEFDAISLSSISLIA